MIISFLLLVIALIRVDMWRLDQQNMKEVCRGSREEALVKTFHILKKDTREYFISSLPLNIVREKYLSCFVAPFLMLFSFL